MSKECSVDTSTMPWLWAHNKPVLDELQTVTGPLADELGAYVEADVAKEDGVARETLTTHAQRGIPFGVPYTLLPPRFFSGLYDDAETPQLPRDESEAHQLVASYAERCLEPPMQGMPERSYTTTPEGRMGEILDDLLWMMQRDTVIDPIKWEQYRQVAREQVQHGRYDLDIISVMKTNSIKSLYHFTPLAQLAHMQATSTFEHYMSMPTSALDVDGHSLGLAPVGYLFMPEVAYGPRFSEKLLRTTAYMVNSAQQVLGGRVSQLAQNHQEIVARHTTRGREGRPADASLVSMAQEGARSSMEAVAFLTAEAMPGYDDPDQLLKTIVEQGIIEEFTRAIPMGMLGPLMFAGKYFPNLLLHKSDGKLALNPLVMNEIKQAKRAMAQHHMAEWALYWAASEEDRKNILPPVETSLVCPAAMPRGALTRMNSAFLQAYRAFDFSEKSHKT